MIGPFFYDLRLTTSVVDQGLTSVLQ